MIRALCCLILALIGSCCIGQIPSSGLRIEYGPNLGTTHTDGDGTRNFYVHVTAIITNDSTIPIQLNMELAESYAYPSFCGDSRSFKAFFLPEDLTPDTATVYNGIVNGQHHFLDSPINDPTLSKRTLNPGEFCVVTIGSLTPKPSNCAAVPRAIFSTESAVLYTCDELQNQALSSHSRLELFVKIEYYNQRKLIAPGDGCVVIPFGHISFPKR